jgi:hypothetical protein
MKLRIFENTIRVRMNQTDVAQFSRAGRIEGSLPFPNGRSLSWRVETGPAFGTTFDGARIVIVLPEADAMRWATSDTSGVEGVSGDVRLLIEKDFQCLHGDPGDQADTFPNPKRHV